MFTDFTQLPLTLTVDDLCKILSITRNTAYGLLRSKQIRSIQCGRQYRIPKDALIDYLRGTAN